MSVKHAPREPRYSVDGAAGGAYAVIWDRGRQVIALPNLRTGHTLSDDDMRDIAAELNAQWTDRWARKKKGTGEEKK